MRTGDEDERLRDDGDLEVDDRVQLPVVGVDGEGRGERDAKLVLEERGLLYDNNKGDPERALATWMDIRQKKKTYVDIVR